MSVITWVILIVVGFFVIKAASGIWYTSQASTNPHYWRLSMINDIRRRANIFKQRGLSPRDAFLIAAQEKARIMDGFTNDHPAKILFADMLNNEIMLELINLEQCDT